MAVNFTPDMLGYSGVEPFRFWCQKVIPLVYDDSLSYYELLNKVVDYLNNTIQDVANVETNVENLLTAYNQLQEYVNDYFDNLDVQDEINNKLDDMVEDGTLDALVAPYLDAFKTQIYDTVNTQNTEINLLKARMDTFSSLPDGSTAGEAELEDIRVANNGRTFSNAGTAVRTQVSNLWEGVDRTFEADPFIDPKFILGGIDYNMPNYSNTTRAFTGVPFKIHFMDRVYAVDETYEFLVGVLDYPEYGPNRTVYTIRSWGTARMAFTAQYEGRYAVVLVRKKGATTQDLTDLIADINSKIKFMSAHKAFVSRGLIGGDSGITDMKTCIDNGWYGFGASDNPTITDLPEGFYPTGGNLFVYPYAYKSDLNGNYTLQELVDGRMTKYRRLLQTNDPNNPVVFIPWQTSVVSDYTKLKGKNVVILGDSISTNGNQGTWANVPEITVQEEDVGVQLSAYLTYYDYEAGLTLGGHTFTENEIGTEVTFTPVAADIGKSIGKPNNYNPNSMTVWWEYAQRELGFNPIPACWSGSSITAHEGDVRAYKTSYAWHPAQIRKCGIRIAGSMARNEPDVIIITRGGNDMTHSPYTVLTEGYFDNYNWQYPVTDLVDGNYGFKEGYALTIKKLREAYPNAQIMLATFGTLKRVNYSHFPTNNGLNSLPQYNDAVREIANFFGCETINFDRDGITFENCYSGGYITDSAETPTHPSAKGHAVMGRKAITELMAKYSNLTV